MIDKNTKHQIIEAIRVYMTDNKLSQDAFVEHVKKMNGGMTKGFSVAYLNDMLKDKLTTGNKQTPIDDKYFYRAAQAIRFTVRKSYRKHHENDNFYMCLNTYTDARESRMPFAIDGPTGEGKSYSAQHYLMLNPKNTYYVRCDGDLTAKSFFMELANALHMQVAGPIYDIRKNVIFKLKNETDPLLIIDEAENLKDRAWESMKRIMDDLKGYCGIVFIGANDFEKQLQKKADKMKGCFPQVLRRIREGGINQMFSLTVDDAIDICKTYGITSKQHVKALFDRCRNIAQLTSMIEKVLREADHNKGRNVLELIELYCNVNLKMKVA
jgi:DNA transposition AAA+ family ATPase